MVLLAPEGCAVLGRFSRKCLIPLCSSELTREKRPGTADDLQRCVIVDVFREQARSYGRSLQARAMRPETKWPTSLNPGVDECPGVTSESMKASSSAESFTSSAPV